MEIFAGRNAVQVQDLDRLQEFRVLYKGAEIEQEIGQMGLISVSV